MLKMREYIILSSMLIFSIFVYGQEGTEIPLSYNPTEEILSGTYIKDIDNFFAPYLGTWEGILNDKKFTLRFEAKIKELNISENGYYYYEDRLIGKYKIENLANNEIIEDFARNPVSYRFKNNKQNLRKIFTRNLKKIEDKTLDFAKSNTKNRYYLNREFLTTMDSMGTQCLKSKDYIVKNEVLQLLFRISILVMKSLTKITKSY